MRVTLLAVGRSRRGPEQELVDGFAKRLRWPFALREVGRGGGGRRCRQLLAAMPRGAFTVALDARGRQFTSEDFAAWLRRHQDEGTRELAFVIGGPDGLAAPLTARCDAVLSLGPMTWPHLLARAMLLEQLYRASGMIAGHPYHRG